MSHSRKKRISSGTGDKGRPINKVLRQWFKKHGFSPQLVQYGEPVIRRFITRNPTTDDVENVGLMIAFLDRIAQVESERKIEKEIRDLIKKGFKIRRKDSNHPLEEDLIPFFREMLARHAWMFPQKHPSGWMPPPNLLTKNEKKHKVDGSLAGWMAMEAAAFEFLDLPAEAYIFLNQSYELRRIVNQLEQTSKEKLNSIKKAQSKKSKDFVKSLKEKMDEILKELEQINTTKDLWRFALRNSEIIFMIARDVGIKARKVFNEKDADWILQAAGELQPRGAHLDLLASLVFSIHDLIPESTWLKFFNTLDDHKIPYYIQLAALVDGKELDDFFLKFFDAAAESKNHVNVLGSLLLAVDRVTLQVKDLLIKIAKGKWLNTPELAAALAIHCDLDDLPTLISIARKKKEPHEQLVFIQMFTYFALLRKKELRPSELVNLIMTNDPPSRNLQVIGGYVEKLISQKWFLDHFQTQVIPLRVPRWFQ